MRTHRLLLATLLGALALPASAVDAPPAKPAPLAPARMQVVTNAPYSAEIVTEQQQVLGDGNQITNTTISYSYRDSAGRSRQEFRRPNGEFNNVILRDVVENVIYHLNPRLKTATRIVMPAPAAAIEANAKPRQVVKKVERQNSAELQENVRVRLARALEGVDPAASGGVAQRIAPVVAAAFSDLRWSAKTVQRDLGSKEYEGVKANGKLRSYEIPAGEIGNRHAIVVADESWYAPELKVTVYTKHSDPRSGDRVYRLTNIKREEPAASLFAVPSDYTVQDQAAK